MCKSSCWATHAGSGLDFWCSLCLHRHFLLLCPLKLTMETTSRRWGRSARILNTKMFFSMLVAVRHVWRIYPFRDQNLPGLGQKTSSGGLNWSVLTVKCSNWAQCGLRWGSTHQTGPCVSNLLSAEIHNMSREELFLVPSPRMSGRH